MKWRDMAPERREAIIGAAAARLAAESEDVEERIESGRVTVADLADYARGRTPRASASAIRSALQADPAFCDAFDALFDHYAKVSIPMAMAASSGAVRKRRRAESDVEIEWSDSSAEPNTLFVRVHAPSWMRPVRELVMRGDDGDMRTIALVDDGEEVEVLIDRRSPEFELLVNDSSKLWLR